MVMVVEDTVSVLTITMANSEEGDVLNTHSSPLYSVITIHSVAVLLPASSSSTSHFLYVFSLYNCSFSYFLSLSPIFPSLPSYCHHLIFYCNFSLFLSSPIFLLFPSSFLSSSTYRKLVIVSSLPSTATMGN